MKNISYKFKNEKLMYRALTHSSKSEENYERLEFLGDSILDFVVGEYFYLNCPEKEGRLSVLRSYYVSENYLSKLFDKLNLADKVILGKSCQGEITKAIKADIIEAMIAAIYLDGGLENAKKFIFDNFKLENYGAIQDDNFKTKLQELVQGNFKCKMHYKTLSDGSGGFVSTFCMDEDEIASGQGLSKQQAEQDAAKNAINKLFLINKSRGNNDI